MPTSEKARDVFILGLRNQHAVENQAIELLQRQIGRLENYPDLSQRMVEHVNESQRQAERIEQLLIRYDSTYSVIKDAAMSLMANMAALGHAFAGDEILKNSFANLAFENYEIASYHALITLSELCEDPQATSSLNQSLEEEQSMALFIERHIDPTTRLYIARLEQDQTAGR
ncbi:Hypothetical protein GbCGDNIH6_0091 [Granulibacter bethesdensis]|uniref:ferritin-like domain-containing protein n=1 Tax=Granulibacter bethesdensis TaxID=364410 RepID=UPI000909EA12|nr:ferritin-like domain-containing protein [Granulibacter bethesdensis]APH55861.1 Hypothetical protein GbCGDNIH6_0091 [Granulibacter bethesdensis]